MSPELEQIWSRVQVEMARTVDEPTYHLWLEPLRPVELSGRRLAIEAPPHACRWISERFGRILHAAAVLALGPDASVEVIGARPPGARASTAMHGSATSAAGRAPERSGPLGNPKLTFEQFVIGDCNRLAHAAALAVAEMPGSAYNPLFLCGPPGVGKTHLMSSIASLLTAHDPGISVRCTTGEAFTNEFLGALAAGHTDTFKVRFRDVDVLLMDDVQFLERKTKTEEEFFHTFNALHDGGRQIVVTSDRPPHDLQALEDRLRERFEAGLVADLAPPDRATRLGILRMRVHHDEIELADEGALEVIAERIPQNVRVLEGALIRVVAFSSLTSRPITRELAEEVLASLYPTAHTRQQRSVAAIQAATCEHFSITREQLLSPSRTQHIAAARQVAMYLARELTRESLPAIGRQFGGRDHTTVLHAWRRVGERLSSDPATSQVVRSLCQQLGHDRDIPLSTHDRPA